ncbi:unnamed protein product [Anisakis simplex]|uniref:MSP domain-containing protein n=1 Tax=Anisakis simplex TaxID=6269 RepID=A0A0M3KAI2_ANISI|nr:unnamed protein product [Anisakis simplex]
MPASLTITPAVMQVSTKGGRFKHRLKCVGDQRVVFKVKLKARYYNFYKPGKIGHDYLVIQYIIAPSGYDPREPFVKGAEIGRLIFKIVAVEGEPIKLEETTFKGELVTDHGQEWDKPEKSKVASAGEDINKVKTMKLNPVAEPAKEEDELEELKAAKTMRAAPTTDKADEVNDFDRCKTMKAGPVAPADDFDRCKTMRANALVPMEESIIEREFEEKMNTAIHEDVGDQKTGIEAKRTTGKSYKGAI